MTAAPERWILPNAALRPDERRLLLVSGEPAALGSRAFDLLLCLVCRRDRVVSRDELLAEVWPGLVVEESNLTVHVAALAPTAAVHGGSRPPATPDVAIPVTARA